MPDLQQLTQQVNDIARETGQFIASERKKLRQEQIEAKGSNDFVTEVDMESERRLVKSLKALLPESGFITEEETTSQESKTYNWIIDPLDGTTNFIHGLPPYSVSIGLSHNDEMVLGVVYEIGANELFYAWKGGGAYHENKRIHVARADEISKALVATGFAYKGKDHFPGMLETLSFVVNNSHGIRRLGSAAVDLCYVAAGRLDIFYESGLHVWDVAAASLIVQEAGGVITDFSGGNDYFYGKELLAANSRLHQPFLKHLQPFSSPK